MLDHQGPLHVIRDKITHGFGRHWCCAWIEPAPVSSGGTCPFVIWWKRVLWVWQGKAGIGRTAPPDKAHGPSRCPPPVPSWQRSPVTWLPSTALAPPPQSMPLCWVSCNSAVWWGVTPLCGETPPEDAPKSGGQWENLGRCARGCAPVTATGVATRGWRPRCVDEPRGRTSAMPPSLCHPRHTATTGWRHGLWSTDQTCAPNRPPPCPPSPPPVLSLPLVDTARASGVSHGPCCRSQARPPTTTPAGGGPATPAASCQPRAGLPRGSATLRMRESEGGGARGDCAQATPVATRGDTEK